MPTGKTPPRVVTLYFGGAGDDRSGIVRHFHDHRPPVRGVHRRYFLHHQGYEARKHVQALARSGAAVILVGHSWGADAAARVAARADVPVDLLIGVDPVAKLASRLSRATARAPTTRQVITVDGGGDIHGWGDIVKNIGIVIGGGWPEVFDTPDIIIRARHRHDDFAQMLASQGAAHPSALTYLEQAEAHLAQR